MHRKLSDGLFLQQCSEVAELYPNIEFNSMIIDNCCMQVRRGRGEEDRVRREEGRSGEDRVRREGGRRRGREEWGGLGEKRGRED